MEQEKARQLAYQYLEGTISEADRALFDEWYNSMPETAEWDEEIDRETLQMLMLQNIREKIHKDKQTDKQGDQQSDKVPIRFLGRSRVRYAAAAVFLFAVATTYFLVSRARKSPEPVIAKTDVPPGKPGAILKLANGRVINLDTAKNGELLHGISKTDHALTVGTVDPTIQYATLETPRGRTIDLELPDGSKVWLNAGSSIRFPTAFVGQTRKVEITGEAYFEVKHNDRIPFRVKLPDGTEVEDIGTSFNVNAYSDEPGIKTTLIEGSIKIQNKILAPGQQYDNGSVTKVNTDNVIAWRNGKFSFENADLKSTMRKLERWYDVQVKYEDNVPDSHFFGGTQMNKNLSEVLRVLELSGVHFKIEDKTIIVYP